MDAEGKLHFSLIESYYTDERGTVPVSRTGFELEFTQYTTVQPQLQSTFSASSSVRVGLSFVKSDVLFQTTVSSKLNTLQLVSVILSTVAALFSAFAILFTLTEKWVLHRWMRVSSGIVAMDSATGAPRVLSSLPSDQPPQVNDKMQAFHDEADSDLTANPLSASDIELSDVSSFQGQSTATPAAAAHSAHDSHSLPGSASVAPVSAREVVARQQISLPPLSPSAVGRSTQAL